MNYIYILIILFLYHILFNYDAKMGIIKDISELPVWQKILVISIFCLIPFWVVIIYFYYPETIKLPLYKLILIVFVPSLLYYILNLVFNYICLLVMGSPNNEINLIIGSITSILELGILMTIGYFFIKSLFIFLTICFGLQIWRLLILGIVAFFSKA